jgi:hypothetical protein
MTMTSRPCRVRRSAISDPVMPPPTISASHFRFFGYVGAAALFCARKPWRAAAAQVGLLDVVI